jgi:hypothetical protein
LLVAGSSVFQDDGDERWLIIMLDCLGLEYEVIL